MGRVNTDYVQLLVQTCFGWMFSKNEVLSTALTELILIVITNI